MAEQGVEIAEEFVKVISHFLPDLKNWIQEIEDPRCKAKITYDLNFLIWLGILMFVFKLKSCRNISFTLKKTF